MINISDSHSVEVKWLRLMDLKNGGGGLDMLFDMRSCVILNHVEFLKTSQKISE